jgi:hypothetical protein
MRRNRSIAALAAFAMAMPMAVASTIHVPADYPTIQGAINAASSGDTILVAPGSYKERLDLLNKNLILTGTPDYHNFITIVDAQSLGTAITIKGGQDSSTVVSNFVFQHGSGTKVGTTTIGGAMLIDGNSSPQIVKCAVAFSTAANFGGGCYVGKGSSPSFSGCLFSNNFTKAKGSGGGMYVAGVIAFDSNRVAENGAPAGGGGGVFIAGTTGTFTNNTFSQNFAFYGGGVQIKGGSPSITGNIFERNTVLSAPNNGEGAGIGLTGKSTALISGNDLHDNSAHNGGGIYCYDSSPTITLNIIHQNQADLGIGYGGGVSFGKCTGSFDLNQVYANTANQGAGVSARGRTTTQMYDDLIDHNFAAGSNGIGGGLYTLDSSPAVIATTFADNNANQGGGIFATGTLAAPQVDSSILWGNTAGTDPEFFDGTTLMNFDYSDIGGAVVSGSNLSFDPQFIDAPNRNYQLQSISPVIDMGNPGLNPGGNDLAGNSRVNNGVIDMGAFEF